MKRMIVIGLILLGVTRPASPQEQGVIYLDRKEDEDSQEAENEVRVFKEITGFPEKVGTTGLPLNSVKSVLTIGERHFAADRKKVYVYRAEERLWKPVFTEHISGEIKSIEDGSGDLLIITENEVFRRKIDELIGGDIVENGKRVYWDMEGEPSIVEVQRMAVEYAEVSNEKIKEWRAAARWKAVLPKVSLGFSESYDDNVEIYKNSSIYYVVEGPRERGTDWDIDLTWDLSDLVWNSAQTSIDSRSKLMVQLREDILEEVTRLYFERKRVLFELSGAGDEERAQDPAKRIRLEELTAYIDALTGGRFSDKLDSSGKIN